MLPPSCSVGLWRARSSARAVVYSTSCCRLRAVRSTSGVAWVWLFVPLFVFLDLASRTCSCRSTGFCTPAQSRWLAVWLRLPAVGRWPPGSQQVAAWLRWLGGLLGLGGAPVSVLATAMDKAAQKEAESGEDGGIEDRPARVDHGLVSWEVCDHTVQVEQRQQPGGGTGWRMWNSALVLAKYIESCGEQLLKPRVATKGAGSAERPVRVLDVSAGPGLLGLTCAVVAAKNNIRAEVVLTEMPSLSLVQLEQNVAAANKQLGAELGDAYRPATVQPFTWGEDVESSALAQDFDLVLISDCLFIAVRDNIFAELRSAMLSLCASPACGGDDDTGSMLLFSYEERLTTEERGFLDSLTNGDTACFSFDEVAEDDMDLECTLDEGEVGALFAEPAPVRILRMLRRV